MRIGIDLDGVLFDSDRLFDAYAELFDIECNGTGRQNDAVHVEEAYCWSEEHFNKFLNTYFYTKILNEAPINFLGKEIIKKLQNNGHELFVITNRGSINQKEKELTLNRLEKENLKFDKTIFAIGSKTPVCKENHIDIMIENSPSIVEELANNGIKCIYFRDNTKPILAPNVFTAKNWAEVYRIIKNQAK